MVLADLNLYSVRSPTLSLAPDNFTIAYVASAITVSSGIAEGYRIGNGQFVKHAAATQPSLGQLPRDVNRRICVQLNTLVITGKGLTTKGMRDVRPECTEHQKNDLDQLTAHTKTDRLDILEVRRGEMRKPGAHATTSTLSNGLPLSA